MTFYKMMHIPSGMFFKPSKHNSKANLSKKGKVYQMKPTLKWIGGNYRFPIKEGRCRGYELRRVIQSEWQIIKYEVE